MAFRIQATCSECAWQEELFVDEEDETVKCPQCGHTSPNFEPADCEQIQDEQQKNQLNCMIAVACLGVGLIFFLIFIYALEPGFLPDMDMIPGDFLKPENWETIHNDSRSFFKYLGIGGMLGSLGALMFFGASASKQHVVCEF